MLLEGVVGGPGRDCIAPGAVSGRPGPHNPVWHGAHGSAGVGRMLRAGTAKAPIGLATHSSAGCTRSGGSVVLLFTFA
jgi:hypothetical protein